MSASVEKPKRLKLPNREDGLSFRQVVSRMKRERLCKSEMITKVKNHKFPRLMERTSIDPRRARSLPWFEDGRTSYQHHADYLKRLSNLRDELINQEQENLSNALERLKQRQNGKEIRTITRPRETEGMGLEVPPRKALLTTVEQFKRTRPRRSPPRIMPLEGKQIMEPQTYFKSPRSPHLSEKNLLGGSSSLPASTRSPDESFKINLQRLIQPTSSIPNIGRKSTTSNKQLVVDTSPLQKKSTSPKIAPYIERQYKGTLKGGGRLKGLIKPEEDDELAELPPLQYSDTLDQDRMSLEQLKDYYCIYYLPPNTPVIPNDDDVSFYGDSGQNSRRYKDTKKKVSVVEGRSLLKKLDKSRHSKTSRQTPKRDRKYYSDGYPYDSDYSGDTPPESQRKQIVVDMPSIVFNSATPERNSSDFSRQNTPQNIPLRKTYKQNELRQRELKNLIEDVKELNLRNDTLTGFLHNGTDE